MASTASPSRMILVNLLGLQGLAAVSIVRNVLLVPIYLQYVGADLYGAWIAAVGMAAFVQLADLGIPRMLVQRTAALHGASDRFGVGRTTASGLISLALLTLAMLGLLLPLAGWMTSGFGFAGPRAAMITTASRLALLDGALTLMAYGEGGVLLGLQRPTTAMLPLILGQLVGIAVTLVLLGRGAGLTALPLGMLTGTSLALLITTVALVQAVRAEVPAGAFRCHGVTLRELLTSSTLLTFSRLSRVVALQAPGVLDATLLSPAAAAVMDVSRKSSLLIADVVGKLTMSFHPELARLAGTNDDKGFRRTGQIMLRATYLLGAIGVGGVLAFNQEFVRLWTGSRLFGGEPLTALFCASALLQLMGVATFFVLLSGGAERIITRAALFEAVLQILLAVALGRALGLVGIALGTVVAAAAGLAVQAPFLLRLIRTPMPWHSELRGIARGIVTGLLPIALGAAFLMVLRPGGWVRLGLQASGYVLVSTLVLITVDDEAHGWLTGWVRPTFETFCRTDRLGP